MDGPRARRTLVATGLVVGGVALVVLGPPVCPTALFLGVPCPGCGLTRATLALFRGDFATALHLHPLVFLLTPLFAYALGVSLLDYVRGFPSNAPRLSARFSERARYGAAAGLFVVAFGGPVPVESVRTVATRLHGAH